MRFLLLLLLMAGPVRAAPMVLAWDTWLREGPSATSYALDEVLGGWSVDVQGCEGGWCRVVSDRAVGYLPQALLVGGRDAPLVPAAEGCFPGEHLTYERAYALKLCPGTPR